MSPNTVNITVIEPTIDESSGKRIAACQLLVDCTAPLPHAPYHGTVRVRGREATATGLHDCRLLKHFTVEYLADTPAGARFRISADLSDEYSPASPGYRVNGSQTRAVAESAEVVCRRIAGLFGRHCEQYRPPSVLVKAPQRDDRS